MNLNPLNETQLKALEQLIHDAGAEQLIWLSGYFQGLTAGRHLNIPQGSPGPAALQTLQAAAQGSLTILYGSHTGRSEGLAKKLKAELNARSLSANIFAMNDYNVRQLEKEENLLIIVSTHGDGEPPEMAEDFHGFMTGKRAPQLPALKFSVLALGDKSYKLYCQTGKDIDHALRKAGAQELYPLVTCDVDYEDDAAGWINGVIGKIEAGISLGGNPAIPVNTPEQTVVFNKKNPYRARVLEKVKITGRESDKEVYHVEISLKDSGLSYYPGDSLGVLADNPPVLVERLVEQLQLDPRETVTLKKGAYELATALRYHLEITILTRDVLHRYYEKTKLEAVNSILTDEKLLDSYLWGHDVLDLVQEFPFPLEASDLVELLRSLPPRLYSISSSQEAVGEEVHITVSTVRYENKGRLREGACSTYLADRIEADQEIPVYIERNPAFRLPEDEKTPIIMVGAGTGVAPYRAFLQHREASNVKGKSWLFFGERRFYSDFLYQIEWQKYLKKGYLEKIDLAFSRDQEEKVYVQHRLAENQAEIFRWLEAGASFYLCGDMKQMAKDVQKTLLEIIQVQGGLTEEQAREYFKKLKKEKRFQADVY
ncbi:MAG: assimilatory sulfite reductase (NADPH) flavoprotein subunit [Prolixibacteraceae bacterium]